MHLPTNRHEKTIEPLPSHNALRILAISDKMDEATPNRSESKSDWSFYAPQPNLVKISVSLPSKDGQEGYYGATFTKTSVNWRENLCTRASGDIIGIEALNFPLPANISRIVRSVAIMSSPRMTQSAVWIGPRLLLSTLLLYRWPNNHPTDHECEDLRQKPMSLSVETEICSQVLSSASPKVKLVQYSTSADLGIFKLQDGYPSRPDWVDIDWLMDGNEAYGFKKGCKAACVAYNGRMNEQDAKEAKRLALSQSHQDIGISASSVSFDRILQD